MLKNRTLFFGDNLRVLREKFGGELRGLGADDSGVFDLIYLDPPFNSNRNYNVLFKEGIEDSPAQLHAFEDTWHWNHDAQQQFDELVSDPRYPQKISDLMMGLEKLIGKNDMMAYLVMMTVRLIELYRVLKETGSIYLHCDPTASHYLKMVMDGIFGLSNYRNEIVWKRTPFAGSSKARSRQFPRSHDIILFYTKSDSYTFNHVLLPYDDEYYARFRNPDNDPRGPYQSVLLKTYSQETFDRLKQEDRLIAPKKQGAGWRYKQYVSDLKGRQTDDLWTDINAINPVAKERLGYPTQKPISLLERVISASTNEGDWVLDPFGGCGTTAVAAEKLKRNWCIIDVTTLAINLVRRRIEDMYPEIKPEMFVDGYPADIAGAEALFHQDPFEFEYWCCDLVNARPAGDKAKGKMKGSDRGIDGVIVFPDKGDDGMDYRKILVQVKGGHVSSRDVRDFRGTIEREKAAGGIFVTLEDPSKPMIQDAVEAGGFAYHLTGQTYPTIQIMTVHDLLNGKRPNHPSILSHVKAAEKVSADERQSLF